MYVNSNSKANTTTRRIGKFAQKKHNICNHYKKSDNVNKSHT